MSWLWDAFAGWFRSGSVAGGVVVASHSSDHNSPFGQVVGAIMIIVPMLFSAYDKYKTHQKQVDAELRLQVGAEKLADATPLTVDEAKEAIVSEAADIKAHKSS